MENCACILIRCAFEMVEQWDRLGLVELDRLTAEGETVCDVFMSYSKH